MAVKYKRATSNILEMEILIRIRDRHVAEITEQLILRQIIPYDYIDHLIRIDKLRSNQGKPTPGPDIPITNEIRIKFLNSLLQRECCKGTAKLIAGN